MVDINATISKKISTVMGNLAARSLSGCDTVSTYHQIGKGSIINLTQNQISMNKCAE